MGLPSRRPHVRPASTPSFSQAYANGAFWDFPSRAPGASVGTHSRTRPLSYVRQRWPCHGHARGLYALRVPGAAGVGHGVRLCAAGAPERAILASSIRVRHVRPLILTVEGLAPAALPQGHPHGSTCRLTYARAAPSRLRPWVFRNRAPVRFFAGGWTVRDPK